MELAGDAGFAGRTRGDLHWTRSFLRVSVSALHSCAQAALGGAKLTCIEDFADARWVGELAWLRERGVPAVAAVWGFR